MTQITDHLANIERRIDEALIRGGRSDSTVTVVAVSKRHPAAAVVEAAAAGLTHFGENYLQEGLEKMRAVADSAIEWHFIGRVQSNKTRQIASHFAWVDTMDRRRIADRLNAHRPAELPPLNVLIQLNLDAEPQKSGVSAAELLPLAEHISQLPKLRLRGVMGMPPAGNSVEQNRASFRAIAAEAERLGSEGFEIDNPANRQNYDLFLNWIMEGAPEK